MAPYLQLANQIVVKYLDVFFPGLILMSHHHCLNSHNLYHQLSCFSINQAFSSTGPKFMKKRESEGGLYIFPKINEDLPLVIFSEIPSIVGISRDLKRVEQMFVC